MEDRYNVECCEFMHAHDEIVERVQKEMPGPSGQPAGLAAASAGRR